MFYLVEKRLALKTEVCKRTISILWDNMALKHLTHVSQPTVHLGSRGTIKGFIARIAKWIFFPFMLVIYKLLSLIFKILWALVFEQIFLT